MIEPIDKLYGTQSQRLELPIMETALEHPSGKNQETLTYPKLRHQPPRGRFWESMGAVWRRKTSVIAAFSVAAIILHLILRFGFRTSPGAFQIPLLAVLVFGGIPLVYELLRKLLIPICWEVFLLLRRSSWANTSPGRSSS